MTNLQNTQNYLQLENDIAFSFEEEYLESKNINIYYFQTLSYEEREELVNIDEMNDYVNEKTTERLEQIKQEQQ